ERGGRSERGDHRRIAANQIGSHRRKPIELTLGPAILDRHVLTLDIACFLQALTKRGHHRRECVRRCADKESDHRHRRLLRPRRKRRPSGSRAAKRDNEFSPPGMDCHVTLPGGSCPCNGGDHINTSRAALRDFKPAYVCCGSWSCKNVLPEDVRTARTGEASRCWRLHYAWMAAISG